MNFKRKYHLIGGIITISGGVALTSSLLFILFDLLLNKVVNFSVVDSFLIISTIILAISSIFFTIYALDCWKLNPIDYIKEKMNIALAIIFTFASVIIGIIYLIINANVEYIFLILISLIIQFLGILIVLYQFLLTNRDNKTQYALYIKQNMDNHIYKDNKLSKQRIISFIVSLFAITIALVIVINSRDSLIDFKKEFYGYYKSDIITGLANTMLIAISGLVIGVIIGVIIGIIEVSPSNSTIMCILKKISNMYVSVFRGTPMVVQLLILCFIILSFIKNGVIIAIIGFGLNSGAYVSEIIRGGINSVPIGQKEAAKSLGLTHSQSMIKVIIPQSIKNVLPSIGNEFISLLKETSIVSFIAVIDLTKGFRQLATSTFNYDSTYIILGVVYFVIVFIVAKLIRLLERMLAKSDRAM